MLVIVGWWEYRFLCDDAYIEFRYAANLVRGWGLTWNPPPFVPVEGYTSFLWVVLLAGVWAITGVEPPDAAIWLSLGLSLGSLAIVIERVLARPADGRWAWPTAVVTVLLVVTNRTFLAWSSSGLETALFTFLFLGWVRAGLAESRVFTLASWAGLAALARPDGLLFVGLTGLYGVWEARRASKRLLMLLPLLLPLVHTLWRHGYYGMWLPNTYYAKHVAPWPEVGAAYVAAFILEYGYIVWLIVAAVAIVRVRRFALSSTALVVTGVFGHFLYYTAIIGGDHFEFRVYQPLVVALALSFAPLARTFLTPGRTFAALTLGLFLGLPIPWAHHALTRGATHYKQPESFIFPIAEHVPWPLSWYAVPWDALHRHLLSHFVGIRVEGHRTYLAHQVDRFPTREEGGKISGDGLPVLAHTSVGYPAWTMPNVAILDKLGLNDRVIARTPKQGKRRKMAHDRRPPKGYVECFDPNVSDNATVRPRVLTDADVRACEARFGEKVGLLDDPLTRYPTSTLVLSSYALAWTSASTTVAVAGCTIAGVDGMAMHTHGGDAAQLASARFTVTCAAATTIRVEDVAFLRGNSCDVVPEDVASHPRVAGLATGGSSVEVPAGATQTLSVQFAPVEAYYTYCSRFAFRVSFGVGTVKATATAETNVSREEPYRE